MTGDQAVNAVREILNMPPAGPVPLAVRDAWEDNLTARARWADEFPHDTPVIPVDDVIDLLLDAKVTTAPGGVDDPS